MNDDLILRAARLAAIAHNGQKRKWAHFDDSYVSHPMRVAGLVALSSRATPEMVAAAWVHDVLEDTKLIAQDISDACGDKVLELVWELTNASFDSTMKDKPRAERKAADRRKIAGASWEARFIKLADRIDNLRDMNESKAPADFAELYKKESKFLLEVLRGTDTVLEKQLENLIGCVAG